MRSVWCNPAASEKSCSQFVYKSRTIGFYWITRCKMDAHGCRRNQTICSAVFFFFLIYWTQNNWKLIIFTSSQDSLKDQILWDLNFIKYIYIFFFLQNIYSYLFDLSISYIFIFFTIFFSHLYNKSNIDQKCQDFFFLPWIQQVSQELEDQIIILETKNIGSHTVCNINH